MVWPSFGSRTAKEQNRTESSVGAMIMNCGSLYGPRLAGIPQRVLCAGRICPSRLSATFVSCRRRCLPTTATATMTWWVCVLIHLLTYLITRRASLPETILACSRHMNWTELNCNKSTQLPVSCLKYYWFHFFRTRCIITIVSACKL